MKNLILLLFIAHLYCPCAIAQGKYFGGNSPASYSGASTTYGIPLFVDYEDINVSLIDNVAVLLEWTTLKEVDNSYFLIQRMTSKNDFITLAKIVGLGNHNQRKKYQYTDLSPHSGFNYYRIVQVDFDGSSTISDIYSISYNDTSIEVYPNPSHSFLHLINVSEQSQIYIYDLFGRNVFVKVNDNVIDINELKSGNYILKIILPDHQVFSTKFVKTN